MVCLLFSVTISLSLSAFMSCCRFIEICVVFYVGAGSLYASCYGSLIPALLLANHRLLTYFAMKRVVGGKMVTAA